MQIWLINAILQKKEQKLAQEQQSGRQLGTNDSKQVNGKSPERSDSPTSTSTATSVGTLTPPSQGNNEFASLQFIA